MNDRKHILVGLFVIGGLILLAVLIIWFKGVAGFLRGGYTVEAHLESSAGIRDGKPVFQDGLGVGDVLDVASALPEKPGVWIRMRINPGVRIPADAQFVAQQSAVGETTLDFQSPPPKEGEVAYPPASYLPTDGTARVRGISQGPSLLPKQVVDDLHSGIQELKTGMAQLKGLDAVIANLRELSEPRTLADVKAGKRMNLCTTLEQFEVTAKSLQGVVENPDSDLGKLLAEARAAAKQLREAVEKAGLALDGVNKAVGSFDAASQSVQQVGDKASVFIDKLSKDADRLSATLDHINAVVADIRQGKGTLGQLVANDTLHRQMVNLVENLRTLTDNANRVFTLWREEGLMAKEKKDRPTAREPKP